MTRRHLFVMDPVESVDPTHDTTYVLMEEAERRGVNLWCCRNRDLFHRDGTLRARCRPVTVRSQEGDHARQTGDRTVRPTGDFDLVWMRTDPPFDAQYLFTTYLLDEAPVPVINDPTGLRNANEKVLILRFPELIPDTWVGASVDEALNFIESLDEEMGVLKSLSGYGGEEVFRVHHGDDESTQRIEALTDEGQTPVMIQQYLPSVTDDGDRRLIVLGGEPIGGLTRHPAEGDFRSNLHSGGRAGEVGVNDRERDICEQLKPELINRGLHFVGVDLVDGYVTEINVTSPTCVQEINRATGERLEQKIVDYVEEHVIP